MVEKTNIPLPHGARMITVENVPHISKEWTWEHMLAHAAPDTGESSKILGVGHLFVDPRCTTPFSIAYVNFGERIFGISVIKWAYHCALYPAGPYHECAVIAHRPDMAARFEMPKGGVFTTESAEVDSAYRTCGFGWSEKSTCKGALCYLDRAMPNLTWFAFLMQPWVRPD